MDTINMAVNMAGFKAGFANPGQWIPEIEEPVVAISLEQVDSQNYQVTIRAEVVSPVTLGGQKCEEEILRVVSVMEGLGGSCRITSLEFDAKTELFSMAVLGTFYGDVLDEHWSAGKACTVYWGGQRIGEPLSFTAWRETSDAQTPLSTALWHFRMEEVLDGKWPEVETSSAFTIQVTAGNTTDTYTGCVVTSQERILSGGHLRQIREGTATAKEAE